MKSRGSYFLLVSIVVALTILIPAVLLSSANLTEFAMNLNMEMGVYLKGTALPGEIHDHLHRLILSGTLQPMKRS